MSLSSWSLSSDRQTVRITSLGAHSTTVRSGLPFSTMYVASSAARPVPTFLAEWIVPAGMKGIRQLRGRGAEPAVSFHLVEEALWLAHSFRLPQRRNCVIQDAA